jgi:hypothetical protein
VFVIKLKLCYNYYNIIESNHYWHLKMENSIVNEYLASLTPKEKKAYEIAKEHLGCLLDVEKTNGFLKWIKTKKPN